MSRPSSTSPHASRSSAQVKRSRLVLKSWNHPLHLSPWPISRLFRHFHWQPGTISCSSAHDICCRGWSRFNAAWIPHLQRSFWLIGPVETSKAPCHFRPRPGIQILSYCRHWPGNLLDLFSSRFAHNLAEEWFYLHHATRIFPGRTACYWKYIGEQAVFSPLRPTHGLTQFEVFAHRLLSVPWNSHEYRLARGTVLEIGLLGNKEQA